MFLKLLLYYFLSNCCKIHVEDSYIRKMNIIRYKRLLLVLVIINIVMIIFYVFSFLRHSLANVEILKSRSEFSTLSHLTITSRKKTTKASNANTKYILYWIPMWNSKTFAFESEGFELFRHCKHNNCFATHNRNILPFEEFDAIIFHAAQYDDQQHGMPEMRMPNQRYIFATMESPTRAYPSNLHKFRSFYNWTMTYRYDSDIFLPYGYIHKRTTSYTMPPTSFVKRKSKFVAWFVSNCLTINRRENIYRNLRRFVNIDVYGVCGTLKCPKKFHESSSECYDLIEKEYKFYFSFENSHCKDYVTEKLYRLLERNIIPIVYGAVDYIRIAPPNSVIIADNYPSAQKLSEYLLFLDRNVSEYLKFFEWKKSYHINRDGNRTACSLCSKLNDASQPPKVYEDIFVWWVGKNHTVCKLGRSLPQISLPDY